MKGNNLKPDLTLKNALTAQQGYKEPLTCKLCPKGIVPESPGLVFLASHFFHFQRVQRFQWRFLYSQYMSVPIQVFTAFGFFSIRAFRKWNLQNSGQYSHYAYCAMEGCRRTGETTQWTLLIMGRKSMSVARRYIYNRKEDIVFCA